MSWTPTVRGSVAVAGLLLLLTPPAPGDGPAPRPNILWILAEDMGPELGSYGYPGVRTPHLDRLAREGMRFTHAFTTAPTTRGSESVTGGSGAESPRPCLEARQTPARSRPPSRAGGAQTASGSQAPAAEAAPERSRCRASASPRSRSTTWAEPAAVETVIVAIPRRR